MATRKQDVTKSPALAALDAVAARYGDVSVKVWLDLGKKAAECMLYQSRGTSAPQAYLGGKLVGELGFSDAIATIARKHPKATVQEDSLQVGTPRVPGQPSLRTKALKDALLAAWREVYAR